MNQMYEVILTKNSFCPICDKPVHLQEDRNNENPKYICHQCKLIGQDGIGLITPLPDQRIITNVQEKNNMPFETKPKLSLYTFKFDEFTALNEPQPYIVLVQVLFYDETFKKMVIDAATSRLTDEEQLVVFHGMRTLTFENPFFSVEIISMQKNKITSHNENGKREVTTLEHFVKTVLYFRTEERDIREQLEAKLATVAGEWMDEIGEKYLELRQSAD